MLSKKEFVNRFSKKGYTKIDSNTITDDFIMTLREIMAEGESVAFKGFGTFKVKDRAAKRVALRDGQDMIVPAHKAPLFSAGAILKQEVKDGVIRN